MSQALFEHKIRPGVIKRFSWRAALTIQELAEGRIDLLRVAESQCLKS